MLNHPNRSLINVGFAILMLLSAAGAAAAQPDIFATTDSLVAVGMSDSALILLSGQIATIEAESGANDTALIELHRKQGLILLNLGRQDEAEPLLRKALDLAKALDSDNHARMVALHMDIGVTLHGQQKLAEAVQYDSTALRLHRASSLPADSMAFYCRTNLVSCLIELADTATAVSISREAVDILESIPTHPDTLLGRITYILGRFLYDIDELSLAARSHLSGERFFSAELGPDNSWSLLQIYWAASALQWSDQVPRAESLYTKVLRDFHLTTQTDSAVYTSSADGLAGIYSNRSMYDSAAVYHDIALQGYRAVGDTTISSTAVALENLANDYYQGDRDLEAIPLLEEAIDIRERYFADEDIVQIGLNYNRIGNILFEFRTAAESVPYYQKAIDLLTQSGDTTSATFLSVLGNLASTLSGLDPLAAESVYVRLIPLAEQFGTDTASIANNINDYGLMLLNQGRLEDAEVLFRRSLLMRETVLPGEPNNHANWHNLAYVVGKQGRLAESDSLYAVAFARLFVATPVDSSVAIDMLVEQGGIRAQFGLHAEAEAFYHQAYLFSLAQGKAASNNIGNTAVLEIFSIVDQNDIDRAEDVVIDRISEFTAVAPHDSSSMVSLIESRAIINIRQQAYETAAQGYLASNELLSRLEPVDSARIAGNLGLAGWSQLLAGNYTQAGELLQSAYEQWSNRLSANKADTAAARALAEVCTNLGRLSAELEEKDRAFDYFQEALSIAHDHLPPNHSDVITWQIRLIDFLVQQARFSDAEPILNRLLATTERYYSPDDTIALSVLTRQAMLDVMTGKVEAGQTLVRQVVETRRRINHLSTSDLADAMILLAVGHRGAGNYIEAEQLLRRVINDQRGTEFFDATTLGNSQAILGDLYLRQWKLNAAESLYTSLLVQEREQWKEIPRVGNHQLTALAGIYILQGRFDLAQQTIDTFDLMCQDDTAAANSWRPILTQRRADLAMQKGDYRTAIAKYRELLDLLDPALEEHTVSIYQARTSCARAYFNLRQYASADSVLPSVDSQLTRNELASSRQSFEHVVLYGHLQREIGRLDNAEHFYQQVISVLQGHEKSYAANYAEALMGMGRLGLERQDYRVADSFYSAATRFLYRYLGESHPLYSEALLGSTKVKTSLAQFAEAGVQIDRAISTIQRTMGQAHPLLAQAYDVQGLLFTQQARFVDAESSFVVSNRILSAFEDQTRYANIMYQKRMAELAVGQYRPDTALVRYGNVIGPILEELGPFHSEVVSAFLQGAEVLLDMGLYFYVDTTLGFFDSIKDEELGQRILTATGVQLVRGRLAMARGDFATAERMLRGALNKRMSVLGSDAPSLGECYTALGSLYAKQNRFDEAERARKQTVAIYRASYGDLHPLVAKSTLQLAEWLRDHGDYQSAEPLFREALQTFGHIYGSSHANMAASVHGLADLHMKLRHYDEAETMYEEEFAINSTVFGQDHPSVAANFVAMGNVSLALGKISSADTMFMAAQVVYQRSFGGSVVEMVPAMIGESKCALTLADWPRALGKSRLAFETAHEAFRRNALALSEADALNYSRQISDAAQMYLTAFLRADTVTDEWVSTAVDIILQVKGQVSEEIFSRHRALGAMNDSTIVAMNEELREISLLRTRRLTTGAQDQATLALLDSLNTRAAELESELALRSSEYRQMLASARVSAKEVGDRLPDGACLIEYFGFTDQIDETDSTRERYLAIVLNRGRKPQIVDLGPASIINEYVSSYRRHLAKASTPGYTLIPLDAASYALKCRPLWESIWKPVEQQVAKAKMVMVAPDAALNLVSFSALKDSTDTYLIEKYPIHYLSSGRDLLTMEATSTASSGLFAMGDPDYSATPAARIKGEESPGVSSTDTSVQVVSRNVRSSCGTLADMKVSQLPSTRREVEQIMTSWKAGRKEEITPFFGAQASEDNIKRFSPGHRVVHIATHGFFLSGSCSDENGGSAINESPLLQSGLLLAGANLHGAGADSAGIDDGILTAEEVVTLPLTGTQLVVLSACETGLGEVKAGEGVYGLRRAFLLAGARTVISSLWPVPDKETAAMMSQLYSSQGSTLPATMRRIQLDRIAQTRTSGAVDHPFSWGAFIILGDWN